MSGRILMGLLFALVLTGCTTVTCGTVFNGVKVEGGHEPLATVEVENSGWIALGFIPLASGNPDRPNKISTRLFRNTVTLENNLRVLNGEARAQGAGGVVNITSHWTDESVFMILLKRHAFHTSAVLLKPEKSQP